MSSYPSVCNFCYKAFSGPGPASQHFVSSEHLRKAEFRPVQGLACLVCRINCDTRNILQDHESSQRHLATLEKKKLFDAQNLQTDADTPAQGPVKKFQSNVYDKGQCDLCGVSYTSQQHQRDHENGRAHLKKVAQYEAMNNFGGRNQPGKFVNVSNYEETAVKMVHIEKETKTYTGREVFNADDCDICEVKFTGPESKRQHMASEKHKKKVLQAKREASGDALPLSCNACGVRFNGPESAEMHFASAKHKRNVKNSEIKGGQSVINPAQNLKQTNDIIQNISKPQSGNIYQFQQKVSYDNDEDGIMAKPFPRQSETGTTSPIESKALYVSPTTEPVVKLVNDNIVDTSIKTSDENLDLDFQPLRLDGDSFSSINTAQENVNFVHNKLHSPPVSMPLGRGRGIFSLLENGYTSSSMINNPTAVHNDPDPGYSLSASIHEKADEDTEKPTNRIVTPLPPSPEPAEPLPDPVTPEHVTGRISNTFQHVITSPAPLTPVSRSRVTPVERNVSADQEYIFDAVTGRGRCFICDINFTSLPDAQQHVSGQKHRKAKTVKMQLLGTGQLDSYLVCKICTITFTGPEAREQHMNSERHIAKERALLMGKTEYFCDICKISCSGPDNYQQHLTGSQHLKMTGGGKPDITEVLNLDRTQWYKCDICRCNLNSAEQLRIHKRSPKHMKQLEKMTKSERSIYEHGQQIDLQKGMGVITVSTDRTQWHHCEVCNCNLNTVEQIQKHKNSPAHKAKAMKGRGYSPDLRGVTNVLPESSRSNHVTTGFGFTSQLPETTCTSPLESFLSEPLFPDHMVSQIEQSDTREISTSNDANIHFDELLQSGNENGTSESEASTGTTGGQGSNARLRSDLAYATRTRGERGNKTSESKCTSERSTPDYDSLGARPKQLDPTVNNPHASTHKYYCHSCKSPMNTKEQYDIHVKGKRHMAKISVEPAPVRDHRPPEYGQYPPCTSTRPRSYQMELFKKSMDDDILCFLPTGTGKTLVSIMTMSAMLNKCPTKNILFLVDKVLLVLQQAKQITKELSGKKFTRFNPDSDTCLDLQRREVRVASICMGQQSTNGIPLWQHDVVVVTADFCRNLLDKEILRWTDFSLVIFDEAHHCDKGHPFNTLLTNYHKPVTDKPKILGLTASPAGKVDVPKTYQMLKKLLDNMGSVTMTVVEDSANELRQYQSNAEMIIRSSPKQKENPPERAVLQEFNVYITYCVIKLQEVSNIDYYVNCKNEVYKGMDDTAIKRMADGFVTKNIDVIQSSLISLQCTLDSFDKIQLSLLTRHVQIICHAWSSLLEGGTLCARQELEEMKATEYDFTYAQTLSLPVDNLIQMVEYRSSGLTDMFESHQDVDSMDLADMNIRRLVTELTSLRRTNKQSISLVLVRQRGTAILITKYLQNSGKMHHLGLKTTIVVGHGGGGSTDKGMNVNQQKRVLEEIKQFKYQVVVATSVAEEGVDWPECDCVISMYPPTTVTALIQMRGRARQKGSKFIILCSDQEEEAKLLDIMQREANMVTATQMIIQEYKQ